MKFSLIQAMLLWVAVLYLVVGYSTAMPVSNSTAEENGSTTSEIEQFSSPGIVGDKIKFAEVSSINVNTVNNYCILSSSIRKI